MMSKLGHWIIDELKDERLWGTIGFFICYLVFRAIFIHLGII